MLFPYNVKDNRGIAVWDTDDNSLEIVQLDDFLKYSLKVGSLYRNAEYETYFNSDMSVMFNKLGKNKIMHSWLSGIMFRECGGLLKIFNHIYVCYWQDFVIKFIDAYFLDEYTLCLPYTDVNTGGKFYFRFELGDDLLLKPCPNDGLESMLWYDDVDKQRAIARVVKRNYYFHTLTSEVSKKELKIIALLA